MKNIRIIQGFLQQLASLHDLPELLSAEITHGTNHDFIVEAAITPRGQTSAFIKSLLAKVTLSIGPSDYIKGLHLGTLNLSYDHHCGGSNGKRVDYIVASESKFGKEDTHYLGAVERTLFDYMVRSLNRNR